MTGDIVTPEVRSRMMSNIRGKNTKPELLVRSGIHKRGFRYRLHANRIPGKPDIVLPKYQAALFINGCFWHGHDCHLFKWPKTRREFWFEKISSNKKRDLSVRKSILASGWRYLDVWECALKGRNRLDYDCALDLIEDWIKSGRRTGEISSRNTEASPTTTSGSNNPSSGSEGRPARRGNLPPF